MQMKAAVVTGANGMLGSTLTKRLLSEGISVLAITRKGSTSFLPQHPLLKIVQCGMEGLSALPTPDQPYDALYHFAWSNTYGDARNQVYPQIDNLRYTMDAINFAARAGCTRFVGAGSQAEYGRVDETLREDTPVHPLSGYGIAKLAAGQLGQLEARRLGLAFVWVRILSLYGPVDKPYTLTQSAIRALLRKEAVHFTKGEQQWDFLYSEDAAHAFRLLGEQGEGVYVLGSGQTITLATALRALCHAVDPSARVGLGDLPYPEGQTMLLKADIGKLSRDTGFAPRISFEEGIQKTIQWVKENAIP